MLIVYHLLSTINRVFEKSERKQGKERRGKAEEEKNTNSRN